jgi:selenocysteine lyase/cysteine desulfurase
MIYLDNAATSWPKPPGVAAAMVRFLDEIGANPGRSAHRLSIESARIVYAAREAVAGLFNASDPLRVVFGHNLTEALNLALHGLLRPGDHVITSSMEHNSVRRGVEILACGTCLGHYELKDHVAVGEVSNMYTIAETMLGASRTISL